MINNIHRWLLALVLLGIGVPAVRAEPTEAERRAFEQVRAQAEKGDPQAQLELGARYANGNGVAEDLSKAFRWYRKAAEQGLARAQQQVALGYAEGTGVKVDRAEAVRWFRKAADQGLGEAQLSLGMCYARGEGVSEAATDAARWFRKAAEQGLSFGQYELGMAYLEGTGVTKDLAEAVTWIRQAADQGCAPAQHQLGQFYSKGTGMPKDLIQAYKWLDLAASQDDEHASEIRVDLAKLETVLTKEQVAQAQDLARAFQPTKGALKNPGPLKSGADTAGATTGFVTVKADDEVCEIFADGAFVGNSPARLKLTEGVHVVEVRKPGFRNYHRELKVTSGSDLSLRVTLEKE